MVVVVFLLFCGLHNEAGDSKFRKGRQYIAYVGHIGDPYGTLGYDVTMFELPSQKQERKGG